MESVDTANFCKACKNTGIQFFTGVPDSLLKSFCSYLTNHPSDYPDTITANEGAAIAYAAGRYLASGELGMVYLQNSGLGNTINPLLSLADPLVYAIPMVLLIGWRGELGVPDEPQHLAQGKITESLLQCLEIPYRILPRNTKEATESIAWASATARNKSRPVALLIQADTFSPYSKSILTPCSYEMTREAAVIAILETLTETDVIVATTGKTSREVFEFRTRAGHGHSQDFLTVGSMGHASSIALGIAEILPSRRIFILDGDGAAIMHLGTLAIIGQRHPKNLQHVILNNGAHDSVGGQKTAGFSVDFTAIAKGCGYANTLRIDTASALEKHLTQSPFFAKEGPNLLEIRVRLGSRKDLGRPTISPVENKKDFMAQLASPVKS